MSNLFKKAAMFTDIHFGLKGNSKTHNQDCEDFIDWVIKEGKARGCDTCFFLGDWHHTRASISILTLNYSLRALEKLSNAFSQVFFIPGNHDLYYRDKRDIQSAEWARNIKGITIVNEFWQEGDVAFAPWLVGNDYKKIKKISAKYLMGHFELPHFLMNAMVRMPKQGELDTGDFRGVEQCFSGHFHHRQTQKNIDYIGNAFPHNYADAWDDNRGATFLEWGGDQIHVAWPDAPKYRTFKLSEVLEKPETFMIPRTYARVTLDIDISYEEASFIKEEFITKYQLRELSLIPIKNKEHDQEFEGSVNFESVDTIVTSQLQQVESEFYDPAMLMGIYTNL